MDRVRTILTSQFVESRLIQADMRLILRANLSHVFMRYNNVVFANLTALLALGSYGTLWVKLLSTQLRLLVLLFTLSDIVI